MAFEWGEEKRNLNLEKHGVDFLDAAKIFTNPTLERRDDREDYGEERWIALEQYPIAWAHAVGFTCSKN